MTKDEYDLWKEFEALVNADSDILDYSFGDKNTWGEWNREYGSYNKKLHEFVPTLLLTSTVYDCKHCGRAQEKCKFKYCEDEE